VRGVVTKKDTRRGTKIEFISIIQKKKRQKKRREPKTPKNTKQNYSQESTGKYIQKVT
jgi:hypothetical protein